MEVCAHIVVRGIVQGVGYRYFALVKARRLGLSGYTKNLPNGDVEIEIEGDRSMVEELIKELKVGPHSAHVADLKIEWKEFKNTYFDFEVR